MPAINLKDATLRLNAMGPTLTSNEAKEPEASQNGEVTTQKAKETPSKTKSSNTKG